ncbi:MAG: peptidylprolyl isomerase [Planctomycetota bacterium]|jgi:cyclophilin family peptidyl-prolyl cis-trans isomerase
MTNKYQRAFPVSVFGCFLLAWLILPGHSLAQPANSATGKSPGAAMPTTSKLTPEERQKRKQARMQKEMEAEQFRVDTFGRVQDDDTNPLAVEYRQAVSEFQKGTAAFSEAHARLQYRIGEAMSEGARENWLSSLKKSFQQLVLLRNTGAQLYASDPQKYVAVGEFLREMLIADGKLDRFDRWSYAAKALLSSEVLIDEELLLYAGYVGFAECEFDLAKQAWGSLASAGKLPEVELRMLQEIPAVEKSWEKELQKLKEDESKNNPRVEFLTTKGVIEIELFEDEAPEAVANMIYLIEMGYYSRKPFFLVRQHWLAQTGCEKGDGKGTAGFTIRSEAQTQQSRSHFRGSLAVPVGVNTQTNELDINTGGAQFYFSFMPLALLNGKHTVFGRVVDGIEALGMLKVVDLTDEKVRKDPETRPDTIVSARVLRKRDHKYQPTPVLGRLPKE